MPETPASPPSSNPFTGLGTDKALLRSTQRASPPPEPVTELDEAPPPAVPARAATAKAKRSASTTASEYASTLARYPTDVNSRIETIRKVVKVPGKEVSFVRLTPAEKGQLTDIVYAYKRRGRKTTETEINRIAVNFLLEDYRANGATSVLAQVLDALHA